MISTRQLFLRHLAQTSEAPLQLEISHARGVYLYGPDGQRWLDLISGIGLSPLGHGHPAVVKAVQDQAESFMHVMVYGEYVLAPQARLARALCAQLPARLDNVYLVNSGTEATEGAMKLARRATGRYEMLSCRDAYHGSTQGAMSLMSDPYFTDAYRPLLPGIGHIRFNDFGELSRITCRTAALVMETVQAESGIQPPDPAWLKAVRARCNETGTLLILDEIQCGFGRTGHLWAFQAFGIEPDILLLGKGMGGGMPVAAFVAPREIMRSLSHDPVLGHITTFGGHPVCSAAALANLETLLQSDLIAKVEEKALRFYRQLHDHPRIRQIRYAGLMMALDLDDAALVQRVIRLALDRGLVTDWFLFNPRCIRIAPPLIISDQEVDEACSMLRDCLDAA